MIAKKMRKVKKVSYVCLTLLSTLVPMSIKANEALLEDKKYNLIGVALFSGSDFVGKSIQTLTNSPISHVGVIVAEQDKENMQKDWMCLQSTGSKKEVLHGQYPHVHFSPWSEVVLNYKGTVQYRLFVFPEESRANSEWVTGFVEDYNGKSYTRNPFKLVNSLFGLNKHSQSPVLTTAFCSELTAQMLMDCLVCPMDTAGNYLPRDFTSNSQLRLESGIELTPEFPAPKSEFLKMEHNKTKL